MSTTELPWLRQRVKTSWVFGALLLWTGVLFLALWCQWLLIAIPAFVGGWSFNLLILLSRALDFEEDHPQ